MKKHKIVTIMIMMGCLFLFAGCAGGGSKDYEAGLQAMKQGDYSTACKNFASAIKDNDDQPEYFISYGTALLQLHRYGEARSSFERALAASGDNAENSKRSCRGLGIAEYYGKDFDEAEKHLNQAIGYSGLEELNLDCYLYLGALNDSTGDTEQAYEAYQKVLELDGSQLSAVVGKYKAEIALGYEDEAEGTLEAGLELVPESAEDRYMYAKLQFYNEDYDGAEEELKKAIESYDEAYIFLGEIQVYKNQYDDAITYFEEYAEKTGNTNNLTVCNMLGKCYIEKRQYKDAAKWVDKAAEIDASDNELQSVRYNQVIVYEKLKKIKKAYDLAREYAQIYPNDDRFATELEYLRRQMEYGTTSGDDSGSDTSKEQ